MDFLDLGGLRRFAWFRPAGAEPLSVLLINRQKLGLFQDDVRGPNKKARWAKNTIPTIIEFHCGPTAALARTDASIALRTTSGSPGQRLAGMVRVLSARRLLYGSNRLNVIHPAMIPLISEPCTSWLRQFVEQTWHWTLRAM